MREGDEENSKVRLAGESLSGMTVYRASLFSQETKTALIIPPNAMRQVTVCESQANSAPPMYNPRSSHEQETEHCDAACPIDGHGGFSETSPWVVDVKSDSSETVG